MMNMKLIADVDPETNEVPDTDPSQVIKFSSSYIPCMDKSLTMSIHHMYRSTGTKLIIES